MTRAVPAPRGSRLARHRAPALVALAVMVATWLLWAVGVAPAIDGMTRRVFYEVRGARSASASVIFVAIDEATVESWGPPPWSWQRYQELVGHALDGGARAVAVLEPGPRVVPSEPVPADLATATAAGRLFLPPATPSFRQPTVALDDRGVVEAIDLGDRGTLEGTTITADLLDALGAHRSGHLTVNFVGGVDALPTLPAHHVARGDIPAATFRDRILIIGLRGERFTTQVPTPVGPMSPAEVHAHGVHALVDGAAWRRSGPVVAVALVLLLAVGGVFGLRQARSALAIAAWLLGAAGLLFAAGYLLFSRADLIVDLGAPLCTLTLAALGGLVLERSDAHHDALELAGSVARHARAIGAGRAAASDDALQDGFARALRDHVDIESCVWAELPVGSWHLVLSRWHDLAEGDVVERRRDVRRDPWRLPYGSHRPEWASRPFVGDDDQRTLLVPLAAYGQLLGLWIVNLRSSRAVSSAQLRTLEAMADQLAIALEQRRLERAGVPRAHRNADHLPSPVLDAIAAARQDLLTLTHIEVRALGVLESLPIGVLTATMWGHVEQCNAAMTQFLIAAGVADPRGNGLVDILARVTGAGEAAVREVVRALAAGGGPVRLEASAPSTVGPPAIYELMLARVEFAPDLAHPGEQGPSSLVVTAHRRAEQQAAALEWRWTAPTSDRVIDISHLVRDTLVELARGAVLDVRAASPVVVAGDELAAAVRAVLGEVVPGEDEPARVVIEDAGGYITVRVMVPDSSLPGADVIAMRDAAPDTAPAHLSAVVRARAELERQHGRLEISSDLEHGTEVTLRLPKPGTKA